MTQTVSMGTIIILFSLMLLYPKMENLFASFNNYILTPMIPPIEPITKPIINFIKL